MNKKMSDEEFSKMKKKFTNNIVNSETNRLTKNYDGSKIENMSTEGLENEHDNVPNITEEMKREQDEREVRDYYNSALSLTSNNKEIEKMYEDRVKGGKKSKNIRKNKKVRKTKKVRKSKIRKTKKIHRKYK